jgi:outer membrane protein assembly factor BamB
VDAPVVDAASDAVVATDVVPSDVPAGKVSHRLLNGISDKGVLAVVTKDGQIEWQFNVLSLGGEANDAWLLPNGNVVFAYKQGAREMAPDKTVVWNYSAPAGTEVHSCQPLADGRFLVGEAHDGGVGMLREIDATGKLVSTVTVTEPGGFAPHNQFREIRKTPQGTYLVTYLQSNKAVEFDSGGKQLREFPCGSFVAIRLPDGNTLISCGDGHRVIEVDPQNKIVWEVTETEIPGNRLGFAAGLQRLANGNTVICNWPGHSANPNQPQAFELTRDKKVVWELKNPLLGWTSNIEVLDPEAAVGGVVLR